MTSPTPEPPSNEPHNQPITAVSDIKGQPASNGQSSSSTLADTHVHFTSEDASIPVHTPVGQPMQETAFHPDQLLIAKANRMDHQTEKPFPPATTASAGSSAEDLKEVEEDAVAQRFIQTELGAHENIGSALTLVSRRTQTPPSSQQMKEKSFEPPSEQAAILPLKRAHPLWRRVRHRLMGVYQRLFSLALIGNVVALIIVLVLRRDSRPFGPSVGNVASTVAANVTGAILIRQEFFINILYDIFCWTPLWMPLRFRRITAKLYHLGGIHSGCAVSAVMWYILLTALVTKEYADGDLGGTAVGYAILSITYVLLILFLAITLFAIPNFRVVSHNTFELIHRLGGWLAVALFWVLLLLLNHDESQHPSSESLGLLILQAPAFWFLLAVTACIIFPWLRLRHVPVRAEQLSKHAIRLHFNYVKKIGPVAGIRIATSPLKEWHAFATIPSADRSSFSLIVSDAGDWTSHQIANPSTHYWVRGIPVSGVLRMAQVFRKIVIVTTGSGIGPVLSMAFSSSRMATTRVLWSTPTPLETYGQGIVDAVTSVDKDAVIWNTRERGRPHMLALTYQLYKESGAEAVFVISNPSLTSKLVYGMEARGVPAFGPIWDS